ncbi:hypothetical protein CDEST_09841 [Colletotrichum destructivum]|uniref:Transmembrane protein n=1 Tax=Colletotrichum destructivum TaxID=34406 RepID=A0AAX4INL7_9PEZI|nr:hypothetical protein CDEST_09841 [Colletotrichum destructivum]
MLSRIMVPTSPTFEMDNVNPKSDGTSSVLTYEPHSEQIISLIAAPITAALLAYLLRYQWPTVKGWRPLPWTKWLVLGIYLSSFLFVLGSWTFQVLFLAELRMNSTLCSAAGALCLSSYVAIKLVYLFMVDKAHIIRGTIKSRLQSKLYVFNSILVLGIYCVIATLNYVSHGAHYDNDTQSCVVELTRATLLPVLCFDTVVNVYLTSMFLVPLFRLHSIQISIMKPWTVMENLRHLSQTPPNVRLRRLALRTFAGVAGSLIISIVNLTILIALWGEVVWLCLTCCNTDSNSFHIIGHSLDKLQRQSKTMSLRRVRISFRDRAGIARGATER